VVGDSNRFGSKYLLGERIGSGASGEVYRATIESSGKACAVKFLHRDLMEDERIVTRFVRERHVLAGVSHPNVVRVEDLVVDGDRLGIVMELVDGRNLKNVLREGRLPALDAWEMIQGIAQGLSAIHDAGVVHRDLKPANILVANGSPAVAKVSDFGVSHLTDSSLTQASTALGTPLYMAPEQANREATTTASDVYSLGVICFEMLAGSPPFEGETTLAVAMAHMNEPPPALVGAPEQVSELIGRMLAKEPHQRPSASEVVDKLKHGMRGLDSDTEITIDRPDDDEESPLPDRTAIGGRTVVRGPSGSDESADGFEPTVVATSHEDPKRKLVLLASMAAVGVLTVTIVGLLIAQLTGRGGEIQTIVGTTSSLVAPEATDDVLTSTSTTASTTTTVEPATTATTQGTTATTQGTAATSPPTTRATLPATSAPQTAATRTTATTTQTPATETTESTAAARDPRARMLVGVGGNCLDVPLQNFRSGQNLHMWPCNDTIAQHWIVSGDRFTVQGMCLDIEGPSRDEGASAQIWACEDVPQHTWRMDSSGQIISKFSDLCLEVGFGDESAGAAVSMASCDGSAKQRWSVVRF
jgi:serine/threonine-protein kinase